MTASETELEAHNIKELCEQIDLTVDSIDGDKGWYTVTFFPVMGRTDSQLVSRLDLEQRRRGLNYRIHTLTKISEPTERLEFRRRSS